LRANNLLKSIVVLATGALLVLFGRRFAVYLPEFAAWVKGLGYWGPAALMGAYAIASLVLAPAFLLTVMSGAIWGLQRGVLYVMVGATFGSIVSFVVARFLVRKYVERYVASHPRLAAIDRAVESEGFRLVFLLRLSPVVPYILLNYVLGVSRVRFRDYLAGSIGMLPTVVAYVYAGKVAGDVAFVAGGAAAPRGPLWYVSLVIGLIATIAASMLIGRAAKRAIDATATGP
jgi:uncharacterized membrane protein YdjX (TVP38/TMEM64 family)